MIVLSVTGEYYIDSGGGSGDDASYSGNSMRGGDGGRGTACNVKS